jgi:hypothetical protein
MRGDWVDTIHRCVRAGFGRFGWGCGHRSQFGSGVRACLDASDFGARHASGGHEDSCDRHDPGALHGLRAGESPADGECRGDRQLHGALDPR